MDANFKQYQDITIHFSIKDQDIFKIIYDLKDCIESDDGPENGGDLIKNNAIIHHCHMRKQDVISKGFSTELYDQLDSIKLKKVCWNGSTNDGLNVDRILMLDNLKKVNGIAIFIGEIKDGVKEEYDYCISNDINVTTIWPRSYEKN